MTEARHVHRVLHTGDRGADVLALQEQVNHIFEKRGLTRRVHTDSEVSGQTELNKIARAAWLVGLSNTLVDKIRAGTITEWSQVYIRNPEKRGAYRRAQGVRRTRAFQRKIAARRAAREAGTGRISEHFDLHEFNCKDGTPVPTAAIPGLRRQCSEHLEPLRRSGGVVTITSGYRHSAYNARIGGATASYHIYDNRPDKPAVDHVQDGRSAPAVQQWHEGHNPYDGMGFYSGFTHGDDRGYRSRWYGAS